MDVEDRDADAAERGIALPDCSGCPIWEDEHYTLLIDATIDYAIIIVDDGLRIRRWNNGAARTFGWRQDEMQGQPISRIFDPEDEADGAARREFALAERDGVVADERWHRKRDGSTFFASGSVTRVRDATGAVRGYVKILRDETERKRLEEDLARHRNLLESAQNAARTGTFEWDLQTDQEVWTEAMYRLYEIPSGMVVATYDDWLALVHPDDRESCEQALAEGIAFHRPITTDFRILVPAGVRWVSIKAEPVYDPDGQPLRVVGMQVDISERKRAQEALERANRELEQFAYIASHDLQEPLRMVASYMGLLQRGYAAQLDEKAQQYIGFAIDGANRLQRMVQALLEFARLDAKELRRERVEVQHVVAEVLHDLGGRIDDTGARVEVGPMPVVYAQRDHLVRLFLNLIGNALKYRRAAVAPVVAVEAQRHGHEWIFAVADNGIGIPPEQHQRVFELFQRLTTAARHPGSGIGLAVCRKIVERHGGRIWLASEAEKGSTFSFSLPTWLPEEPAGGVAG